MIDVQEINAYLLWAEDRKGRQVDCTPEAYALEVAAEVLVREGRDLLTSIEDLAPFLWSKFQDALDAYENAKEKL